MKFTDTHCHIHETGYGVPIVDVMERAEKQAVKRMICVGTDVQTSQQAVAFTQRYAQVYASIGVHPHEATEGDSAVSSFEILLRADNHKKIVAIGECGLDYFYTHSPPKKQIELLHTQIELAIGYNLPLIFHVREAFDDFWPIFDQYKGLRGVLHSFTDNMSNMEAGLARGLYVGVNGISTFTRDCDQIEMFRSIPLEKLLLETDAPFLTPSPLRGKINEPAFVTHVAQHIANLQSINLEELSRATEQNATTLFNIKN